MDLYRLRLHPLSPWVSQWQADTLAGLLCWVYARSEGTKTLTEDLLEPFAKGAPPFVLSDALPAGMLPFPEVLRTADWPPEQRKVVKRAAFLSEEAFTRFQRGESPSVSELNSSIPFCSMINMRNTVSRLTETTGQEGSLYAVREFVLDPHWRELDIYLRVANGYHRLVFELFQKLADVGFGADVSVGRGQFEVASELEPADWLDRRSDRSQGMVVLSTFQPGLSDPTTGYWQSFVKYGKIGPDFGLENIFKRPLLMFRPGACFQMEDAPSRPWFGRAVPMAELVSPSIARDLREEGVNLMHIAYGLAVPYAGWRD